MATNNEEKNQRKTILLVDDEPAFHRFFKEDFDNFNVLSVYDANSALRLLKSPQNIQLAVIDLSFDGGYTFAGIDLIQAIKQQFPQLPLIALSKYNSMKTQTGGVLLSDLAIQAGAKVFLSKKDYDIFDWEKIFNHAILAKNKPHKFAH